MKDKRVLIISSEVVPYLPQTDQAIKSFQIPKTVNENGGQTRIFMPRYGLINERRHQLHEVIRLSGMNLVINDMDMPLIIKVASIPKERMQVYFIDNEEYFKRRAILHDSEGKIYKDNDERMIFFTKGVIETVKKLNWSPDIIHLNGWFASLFPLYFKTIFAEEPIFSKSKIVSSIYSKSFDGCLSKSLVKKIKFDGLEENLDILSDPDFYNLTDIMIKYSDSIILSTNKTDKKIINIIDKNSKDYLSYSDSQDDDKLIGFLNST